LEDRDNARAQEVLACAAELNNTNDDTAGITGPSD
jgi:hypothetical protein